MPKDDIKSMHIAVYALSLLGGAQQKVHTEMIARKCLELSPDRFKWEHFDYPDKELVRKALFHASEKKNGSLVLGRAGMEQRGKSRDGWQLTANGAAWIREHESDVRAATSSHDVGIRKVEADRFLKRFRAEPAFQQFHLKRTLENVTSYAFTDLLNCTPDAPVDTIRIKFDRLLSIAELVNDKEVVAFLKECGSKFAALLGRT